MKFNKWTVALAGLGVVSLASAAKAEEKASPVMTAVAGTTISGYVDTSAQWNFGTGNANPAPYKFNTPSKADGFNLDVVQLRIEKPLDESEWAAGYRADFWFGPDANTLGTQSVGAGRGDFAIRQAYVNLRMPIGNGLDWKVGVFDSIVGYESVESPNNPNYTRSYGHSIEPQTHTGALATYRFNDIVSMSAGIADTMGPSINSRAFLPNATEKPGAESYKTYMGSVAITAPDSMGFLAGSTLYGGIVNGFLNARATDNNGVNHGPITSSSYYAGVTVATPVTGLRAGMSFDYLDVHQVNNDTWSLAGYASYQATEKLSFHVRAEYFKEKDDAISAATGSTGALFAGLNPGQSARVMALTATTQYDLWKNVISRFELRWDHSLGGNNLFGGDPNANAANSEATARNAFMAAANIIYKF